MQNRKNMEDFVISLLKENLPASYFYHNPEHTLYVMKNVIEIGRSENCSEAELELLNTAALWHDTGYVQTYANHEEVSCELARQYLPEYGYSATDIDKVCGMIMATKIPQMPTTKLEEIIADADLEYLGTTSFENKGGDLFRELRFVNPSMTVEKWNQTQISFLQKHHYFTRFCIENKEPVKQDFLKKLIKNSQ